jgi:hypothetical protein
VILFWRSFLKTNDNERSLHYLVLKFSANRSQTNCKEGALLSARQLLSSAAEESKMYSSKTRKGFWGTLLAFSLLVGIGLTAASTTQAQDRRWEQDQQDRDSQAQDRRWEQNQEDRDWNGDRANGRNRDRDNDGDNDRDNERDSRRGNGRYGRGRYGRYGQGGRGGYGNNGNYGNYGYDVYQQAQQQGYQDGLYTGSSDAQRGQSYDPQRSHYYRNANSGYNSSYGNRGQFQQAYRQGFLQGYQQGYQQYGGYNNQNGNYGRRWPW